MAAWMFRGLVIACGLCAFGDAVAMDSTVPPAARPALDASAPAAAAANLVKNSSLDRDTSGWQSRTRRISGNVATWEARQGRGGTACLHLAASSPDTVPDFASAPGWVCRVEAPPVGRRMRFEAWVRGRDCTLGPVLFVRALSGTKAVLAYGSTESAPRLMGSFEWTRFDGAVDVVDGTARLECAVVLLGGGEVWCDDVLLADLGPLSPEERTAVLPPVFVPVPSDSAYLFRVESQQRIAGRPSRAESPAGPAQIRLQVALPLADAHQVPVGLDLWTEPRESLIEARLRADRWGNCVADLLLDVRGGEGTVLKWVSHVLVPPESTAAVPAAAAPREIRPEEVAPWTRSTRCAQSDDATLAAAAREIRDGAEDGVEIVRRTLRWIERLQPKLSGQAQVSDAVSALSLHGSSVSRANLAVALLRANHIPARMLCGFVTWAGPHQLHLIVEAWLPGIGWYRLDPSRFAAPWPASCQVNVALLPVEAEDLGYGARATGVACLPYLAVEESKDLDPDWIVTGLLDPASGSGQHVTRAGVLGSRQGAWRNIALQWQTRWRSWVRSEPGLRFDGHLKTPFDAARLEALNAP